MQSDPRSYKFGLLSAILAHILWGVFPLFWKLTDGFDPFQVVAHRVLWSFFLLGLLFPFLWIRATPVTKADWKRQLSSRRVWGTYALAAALVAINWLVFIWAVNEKRVLDASLGYYINPLFNVLLGVLVLKERLSKWQWASIVIATFGVGVMTVASGRLPWISLVLASSFGVYSLVKKRASLPTLVGLLLETATLVIPALGFLALVECANLTDTPGAYETGGVRLLCILFLGGTVTILPLAFFSYAARRIPLSTLGVLQYIGPTIQFFLGVWILREDFESWKLTGFVFVWIAVAIYMFSLRADPKQTPS